MSGLGGNLVYPNRPLLINELTVRDFGFYSANGPDGGGDEHHLIIKKIGLDILYNSANTTVQVSKTQEGALKSVLLGFNAPCPSVDLNYGYGISVLKKVKNPGVQNDDNVTKERFYGGTLAAIQACSNGYMADSDKLLMEDEILTQIKNDRDLGTREEAVVDGRRLYIITVAAANNQKLNITDADGTETITMNTGSTALTIAADISTNTKGLYAFALSTTRIAITSTAVGKLFTLANGSGAGAITVFDRYIWLSSRSVDNQFEVRFDYGFLTLTRFNFMRLSTTGTPGNTSVFSINGKSTSTAANGSATSSTFVANLNTAFSTDVVSGYASYLATGSNKDIFVYSGIYEMKYKTVATGVTISQNYSGAGRYPSLTYEDVFREFANKKHLDGKSHLTFLDQPEPGSKWNKITISKTNTIAAQHGANHGADYLQYQVIYLKQGQVGASYYKWDATNGMWESTADNTGFSADTDFPGLLDLWAGTSLNLGIL